MQTITENENINKILAQIRTAIKENKITYKNNTKWIFEKLNNVDFQVKPTNYLVFQQPECIGCTALHFAAEERNLEAFNILLKYGVDFTLKNSNNSTVLHELVEKHIVNVSEAFTLNDTFVDSVLSTHLQTKKFENPINRNWLSHFHIACAANNVEAVKGFLQRRVFVDYAVKTNSPLFPGYTSLHFSAKYCAFEVTEMLLSHGFDVNIKNTEGMTPLHVALERKLKICSDIDANEILRDINDKILQLLLSKESNSDMVIIDNRGLSTFHVSCTLKDSKIVECILPKVVNINHTVKMDSPQWAGYTALHFAALCNVNLVKLLVKKGADINVKNAKGVTPFEMCLERYDGKDIYLILSMNNFTILDKLNMNIICELSLWPCSPMHLVVILFKNNAKKNDQSVQMNLQLLRNIYQQNLSMIHIQDIHGHTPLHLAFRLNKEPVIDLLLEFLNASLNLVDRIDKDGLSYLHIATAKDETLLVEKLLSIGANVNNVYKGKSQFSPIIQSGSTALHIAVVHGSAETVDMLVEHGADVYAKDANDMTPIHAKFVSTKKKMTKILLSLPNLKDSTVNGVGLSHLHVACRYKKSKALRILLDNGADINGRITLQQNVNVESSVSSLLESYIGCSPLIIAYKRFNDTNVRLLLERGADIFVEYTKGLPLVYSVIENCDKFVDYFMATVRSNEALMTRLKTETGMTSLHLDCFDLDVDLFKKSLSESANVNAQISPDSPILKGYTPLHILMHVARVYEADGVIEIIELLLKAGADVTLQNAKLETAVHMAYNSFSEDDPDKKLYLNMLLEAQQDFIVNPTSINGISHFHIACCVCNTSIAEKFLDYGDIDINQQLDYFSNETAGYSALHFATESNENNCGTLKQLDTIDLLLTHGANVEAEDHYGETPFHKCARYSSLDLFERLVRNGGDVNSRNISGHTPLYYYLKSDKVSVEGLKVLIRFGCRLNIYNAVTDTGYLGEILNVLSYEEVQKLFSVLMGNFKQEMRMDDFCRTVIHNIVSIEPPEISADEYAELIGQLARVGYDIDDQDNLGRTALHLATKFRNFKAISGLLLSGADVNITDRTGKTALAGDFDSCDQCEDEGQENEIKCKTLETVKALAIHVKKLQLCGLDVNKQNEVFASEAFQKFKNNTTMTQQFFNELETIKNSIFGSHSCYTLYDLLSEYGVVVSYPRMSELKRNDVNKFFSLEKIQKVREQFPELAGMLRLQYRKAKTRLKLMELAKDALTFFCGYRLPEICSEFILILLKNSELENFITSAISTKMELVNKC